MSHDAPANSPASNKLVIRNIGLLLSGDIDRPILDADTVVAVDGVIQTVGKEKDLDLSGAGTTVDAKGTALAPGLIDSHVHPVCGDWTPRQNQLGWIESCLHGGVTTMVSQRRRSANSSMSSSAGLPANTRVKRSSTVLRCASPSGANARARSWAA
jgi:enamidase